MYIHRGQRARRDGRQVYSTEQIRELIRQGDAAAFYNDRTWRRLSREVMAEQHNECQHHKARGRYAKAQMVHHVMHLRDHPELAYSKTHTDADGKEQRNLVALCFECHEAEHPDRLKKRWNKYRGDERW